MFWASCELWVASYGLKAVPKLLRIFMCTLLGFSGSNWSVNNITWLRWLEAASSVVDATTQVVVWVILVSETSGHVSSLPSQLGKCVNTVTNLQSKKPVTCGLTVSSAAITASTSHESSQHSDLPCSNHHNQSPTSTFVSSAMDTASTSHESSQASALPLCNHHNQSPTSTYESSLELSLTSFISMADPVFTWDNHEANYFMELLISVYFEDILWKINIFKISYRSAGKSLTSKLARLFRGLLIHWQLNQLPWRLPQLCLHCSCRSQLRNWQQETTVSVSSNGWIYGEFVTPLSSYKKGEWYNSEFPRTFHLWIKKNYLVNSPILCFTEKLKQHWGCSLNSIEVESFS